MFAMFTLTIGRAVTYFDIEIPQSICCNIEYFSVCLLFSKEKITKSTIEYFINNLE